MSFLEKTFSWSCIRLIHKSRNSIKPPGSLIRVVIYTSHLALVVRAHMAVYKYAVYGFELSSTGVPRRFFRLDNLCRIVRKIDVDILDIFCSRRSIAGKTSVTHKRNMGAAAVRGFHRQPIVGEIRIRDDAVWIKNKEADINRSLRPQGVIHHHFTTKKIVQKYVQIRDGREGVAKDGLGRSVLGGRLDGASRTKPHWHCKPIPCANRDKIGGDIPRITAAVSAEIYTRQIFTAVICIHVCHEAPLTKIRRAVGDLGAKLGGRQRRQQHCRENGDDGNDHQQFNQGETATQTAGSF